MNKRAKQPLSERFWKHVDKTDTCWLWTGAKVNGGYGIIQIGGRGEGLIRASRLSYILHYGEFPKHLDICHTCDNPSCVRPDHLFLGTEKENVADMIKKGRSKTNHTNRKTGETHPKAKLTENHVRSIRTEYETGQISLNSLALKYNVSKKTILNIVHYRIWIHV